MINSIKHNTNLVKDFLKNLNNNINFALIHDHNFTNEIILLYKYFLQIYSYDLIFKNKKLIEEVDINHFDFKIILSDLLDKLKECFIFKYKYYYKNIKKYDYFNFFHEAKIYDVNNAIKNGYIELEEIFYYYYNEYINKILDNINNDLINNFKYI